MDLWCGVSVGVSVWCGMDWMRGICRLDHLWSMISSPIFESVVISKSAVKLRSENGLATNHVFINTFNQMANDGKGVF